MCLSSILPHCVRIFLHDLQRPVDVYACYRFLFLLGFIGGLVNLEFRSLPRRQLKSTIFSYVNTIAHIGFYIVILVYMMFYGQSMMAHLNVTDISRFTDNMRKFSGTSGIIVVYSICLRQRKSFIKLVDLYETLEIRLCSMGVHIFQKNCSFLLHSTLLGIFCPTIGFILYGSVVVFAMNGISVTVLTSISFYSPHLIVGGVVVIFAAILQKLTLYYRAINKVIILGAINAIF